MRITKKIVKMMGLEPTPEMIETVKTICSLSETGLRSAFQTLTKYTETWEKQRCFLIYFSAYCLTVRAKKAPTEEFKKIISEKYDKSFDVLVANEKINVLQEFAKYLAETLTEDEKIEFFETQIESGILVGLKNNDNMKDFMDFYYQQTIYWAEILDIEKADIVRISAEVSQNLKEEISSIMKIKNKK